ncbi:hypothetical protein BKA70DRAFT_1532833 [Coprinopsis sp. MPI-PUGE-AT-0042]|nr:hypothetical protein BKA70DRAFT_1532833 [Coprinopsis sp. MPI-PUGE-AT-0042]
MWTVVKSAYRTAISCEREELAFGMACSDLVLGHRQTDGVPYIRWSTAFSSKTVRAKKEDEWVEKTLGGMGKHPFDYVSVYHSWASLDESDFNMHLSNSSYAKTLDAARFKVAMEIIGGWDEKWFYVVSKFVMPANKSKKKIKAAVSKGRKTRAAAAAAGFSYDERFKPLLRVRKKAEIQTECLPPRTPSCADDVNSALPSGAATPFTSSSATTSTSSYAAVTVKRPRLRALLSPIQWQSDGEHCWEHLISRSTRTEADKDRRTRRIRRGRSRWCCFKVGRITVPPRLVFALCGLSAEKPISASSTSTSTSGTTTYPPHWDALKKTLNPTGKVGPYGTYDPRALSKLMKGGWKDVSVHQEGNGDVKESDEDEKRWWDAAWRAEGFDEAMRARRWFGLLGEAIKMWKMLWQDVLVFVKEGTLWTWDGQSPRGEWYTRVTNGFFF